MNIAFIGHGYVGLVTAAVFADLGNTVWVVGHTKKKIDDLQKGITPFFEPGLAEMVSHNLKAGRLKFTLDYNDATSLSKIIFICVGTPPQVSGEADLSAVRAAAAELGRCLKKYAVIVTKSTVPVGTNREVEKIIKKFIAKGVKFDIASCPEFLREGSAISDTLHPDRIVIGADSLQARDLLLDLHKSINGERVVTSIETAEMIKYANNALLSIKISFANAMSFICDAVHADVEIVLKAVGMDNRLGRAFLYPGVGFGGSCFPKDVKALIAIAKKHKYNFKLLQAVNEINRQAKDKFIEKVCDELSPLKGKVLAVWGLAFKPNTDDMREAPSTYILEKLQKMGAFIQAYDPEAMPNASRLLPKIKYCDNPIMTAEKADAILVLTEWNEFKQIDLAKIRKVTRGNLLFDGRNIYDPEKVRMAGFIYKGIGR